VRKKPDVKLEPANIDAYLATLSDDKRRALQKLRTTIRRAFPRAEECISYKMPAFRLDGKIIVWFGAAAKHCSLFPGAVVQAFAGELADYEISKGTIRFTPEQPLPAALVKKLIKARIALNAAPRRKPTRARASSGARKRARGR
jgi:uncharacterized protein YdhG (YjbR/CyaY superfamily)